MAFGQEEVERRRQQREALRQKREQEQQQFIKRLTFAGAVLAVAAVVILAVVLFSKSSGKKPAETTAPTIHAALPEDTEPRGDKTVVHFAATGDLNITDNVVASGGAGLDYTNLIADVLPLLAEADLTCMNFEGNVVGPPYGTASASAPAQLLTALRTAGVDMLQMANSCSISNGIIGLNTTLRAIRAAGIEPIGAYATNDDFHENGGYTI